MFCHKSNTETAFLLSDWVCDFLDDGFQKTFGRIHHKGKAFCNGHPQCGLSCALSVLEFYYTVDTANHEDHFQEQLESEEIQVTADFLL